MANIYDLSFTKCIDIPSSNRQFLAEYVVPILVMVPTTTATTTTITIEPVLKTWTILFKTLCLNTLTTNSCLICNHSTRSSSIQDLLIAENIVMHL